MRLVPPTSPRVSRVATIALIACLASSLLGANLAAAGTPPQRTQPAAYVLQKANLGLAPGTGFFLDEAHIRKGLDDFEKLGVHWIRSSIPWQNFEPDDPNALPQGAPQ